MAQGGKFSHPRPHRDEERQIEQAFRQVTGQEPAPKQTYTPGPRATDETVLLPAEPKPTAQVPTSDEEARIEQAFHQVTGQSVPPKTARPIQKPAAENYDLIPEDLDRYFEKNPLDFDGGPEEAPEDDSPDFVDKLAAFWNKAVDFCGKNQKIVLVSICGIALFLIAGFLAIFFTSTADPNDGKILDNVLLADIPVGGMTKNEAIAAVKKAANQTYGSQDMVINLSGNELRLSPRDTGASLDVKAAVQEAYEYGRTGTQSEREQALSLSHSQEHIIGLLPFLDLNEKFIKETLTQYAEDAGSTLTQTTYGLEGNEPALSADKFNEKAPTQTLVIHIGTPGVGFDVNDVYEQVLDAYSLHTFLVTVENVESVKDPDPVDLQKIYDEFYIEPKDASVNMQTFETVPGSYGYGFDMEEAQKLLDEAQFGDTLRIPMEYIAPDILDGDSFYQDILGEHQTRHTSNNNRNTNLRLACQALNGYVLDPGQTFSFNEVVGQRTSAKGYKNAPADANSTEETTMGGGISQVSSTLYYAAMLSDLDIVSRTPNTFAPNFIDYGMDAAVSWNVYDLKLRNNLGYPIQINAEVSGGYVKVQILGTEERDYYVMMDYSIAKTTNPEIKYQEFEHDNKEGHKDGDVIQEGVTGYEIKTYKVKYSRETNAQLSQDFVVTTRYAAADRIIAKVEKPVETTVPTTLPTEPPTQPTTTPTVPETTQPPTTTPPTTQPETQAPTESTAATTVPTTEPVSSTTAESSTLTEQLLTETPAA